MQGDLSGGGQRLQFSPLLLLGRWKLSALSHHLNCQKSSGQITLCLRDPVFPNDDNKTLADTACLPPLPPLAMCHSEPL